MQFNKLHTWNTTCLFHKFTELQIFAICISILKNFTHNFLKVWSTVKNVLLAPLRKKERKNLGNQLHFMNFQQEIVLK